MRLRAGRARPGLAIALGILATIIVLLADRTRIPHSPAAAHEHADRILMPKFVVAFNEWALSHPGDGEHFERIDAGDVARWREVTEAFRELSRAYKAAGYSE